VKGGIVTVQTPPQWNWPNQIVRLGSVDRMICPQPPNIWLLRFVKIATLAELDYLA
jgi:hypothetical protein